MRRRRILIATVAGGAVLAGGGARWLAQEPPPVDGFPDIASVLRWLDRLVPDAARSTTPWPLAQVLEHAAQSIEFSIDGYPQLRSAAFRSTGGALAFALFSRRGRMSHATTEPIPGAPALVADAIEPAASRLREALARFEALPGDAALAPHFAFGALDKPAYRRAHLMHLADHAHEVVLGPQGTSRT